MSWPFVSVVIVSLVLRRIRVQWRHHYAESDLPSVSPSNLKVCVFSQTNVLEEVSVVCLFLNLLASVLLLFRGIICLSCLINNKNSIVHHRADSCTFYWFGHNKPNTWKLHAPSGHLRQNAIYFDLTHGVTTMLTPNLLFEGQIISKEPRKHRAGGEWQKVNRANKWCRMV